MKNVNRSLKIFSVLMLLIFIFSVAAFAEPENDLSQATRPETGENITQDTDVTGNNPEETESITNTQPRTETVTSVKTTEKTTAKRNTATSTTRSRVTTTKSITTTVKSGNQEESDNADLSSLEVKVTNAVGDVFNLILSPEFKANIKTYTTEVKEEVSSVEIRAKAKSSEASVEIPSEIELEQGNNIIKVVVTAGNGTKKTYEINMKYNVAGIEEPTTVLTTVTTTTQPNVTEAVNIQNVNHTMNTYTKLGIVFAVGGVTLLGISIYLFFKRND